MSSSERTLKDGSEDLQKGVMPDLVDPNHTYVYRTGDHSARDYWYSDIRGNYWKYTNAPEDHPDFDKFAGVPLFVKQQPTPVESPPFFTPEGKKRHMAVPPDVIPDRNPAYDPTDRANVWYEVFKLDDQTRYVYLDSDVRENLDLFVQYQLRVTDSCIVKLRSFAADLFQKEDPKDRVTAAILMLLDQGLYEVEDLLSATVSDIEFIDETVRLLGRKFVCDSLFLDFLVSLVGTRDPAAPLFQLDTFHGKSAVGLNYIYSVLHFLGVNPGYLLAWHASHLFSKIVNRSIAEDIPASEIEGIAFSELQRLFVTTQNVQFLVDYKVRKKLLDNYKSVNKGLSLARGTTDEYGTLIIFSDLNTRKGSESEFSAWLHSEPMHDVSPSEEAEVSESLEDAATEDTATTNEDGQEVGTVDKPEV